MNEGYINAIVPLVENEVKVCLVDEQSRILMDNRANGTSEANGFRFGQDETTDFIRDIFDEVAEVPIDKLVRGRCDE